MLPKNVMGKMKLCEHEAKVVMREMLMKYPNTTTQFYQHIL
jgi:hypothetical protein